MDTVQAVRISPSPKARSARRRWSNDLLVVIVLCAIFGLEIIAVMQTAGGPDAYRMVATEGMM